VFHPATAIIQGDSVIVQSAAVRQPVAVRYGWRNAPEANLYNGAGLPAAPFRSDDW
jgi:sialate O-acetylesterase